MVIINLRRYYPHYPKDKFMDVPDEVAAALEEGLRIERRQETTKMVETEKGVMPMEENAALREQLAEAKKKLAQLENHQKILLNKQRDAKRRARNHRLIQHGLILEGVFPAAINTDGEAVKEFLIEVSLLPGARELAEKMLNAGDEG